MRNVVDVIQFIFEQNCPRQCFVSISKTSEQTSSVIQFFFSSNKKEGRIKESSIEYYKTKHKKEQQHIKECLEEMDKEPETQWGSEETYRDIQRREVRREDITIVVTVRNKDIQR